MPNTIVKFTSRMGFDPHLDVYTKKAIVSYDGEEIETTLISCDKKDLKALKKGYTWEGEFWGNEIKP